MHYTGLPQKQGLYDPQFEHDACGIGCISHIKGKASHDIITNAIEILKKLAHRGGVGSEPDTGDGAGILIQLPHEFMKKVCRNEDISLPEKGEYGVGMLFLSPDKETREESLSALTKIIEEEGQTLLGIRRVPVYPDCIGQTARDAMPEIMQVFVQRGENTEKGQAFERKLFVIMKRAEHEIRYGENRSDHYFYFASFSSKTIVFKGMLTPDQVSSFYLDLKDVDMKTAIALVHSRFSTNTFPSWERAHPNRYIIHNGEINTIRGNVNWVKARQRTFETAEFADDMEKIIPVVNEDGSDSAMLDNYLQFMTLAGVPLPQAVMMMIPEPWENNPDMDKAKRDFYEYHSCVMEPWDGPAAIAFTDGTLVGATLDRNGLRPARYIVTKDDLVILSSEVGVMDVAPERVLKKERLHPGKMLLIDTENGRIIEDDEIKSDIASRHHYGEWLESRLETLSKLPTETAKKGDTWHELVGRIKSETGSVHNSVLLKTLIRVENDFIMNESKDAAPLPLQTKLKLFGYSWEDINATIRQTVEKGEDPIGAMGTDIPLAVLSEKTQLLFNYFKQLFAQVTNPPIDAIREQIVTSSNTLFGSEKNMLLPSADNCNKVLADSPILTNEELEKLRNIDKEGFKVITLPMLFNARGHDDMEASLDALFTAADIAVKNGYNIIILSDKNAGQFKAPIPSLLAVSGLHHHLIRRGTRMRASIILESGEPREVHHFASLIGYGADGINPYLAYEAIDMIIKEGLVKDISLEDAIERYRHAETKGIIKVMSKMGISTVQSYRGAQIFEALGISQSVIDKYFTGTVTRIGGLEIQHIEKEALTRCKNAFGASSKAKALKSGGEYKWRAKGEYHMFNPESIYKLQKACRTGDYKLYKEFAEEMNRHSEKQCNIRGMLDIRTIDRPIAIDSVESVESIVKRFKTGAMSYGSISQEAHECLAIAMNRLGGRSNSGEGGEIPERYIPDENGDSRCSAIKQVASGRFGVHIDYLQHAGEIQIKMAQGAKPGEGGHLPGGKVYPWIAKARYSTPGVSLISPPPHHDIYSIEDLAQLIHDLKNANRDARISVKLVSEAGVGTIAVGVAKGRADVILISGYDGGTGAAPRTGVRHAGLPWELGVAETHQALLMNNLRDRVVIETDGKLLTGRDVAVAALLGAEEFGFATGPLIAIGCVMMRVCHLDTCPVGVATQNPLLRKRFEGRPEYVENFMKFIAQDLREWMAKLGMRTVDEMIGHVERLQQKSVSGNWKASEVDLSSLLYQPKICSNDHERYFNKPQNHELEKTMDFNTLLALCAPSIADGRKTDASLPISNINRVTGAILSSEIARKYGLEGLPEDTVNLRFVGSAGQSFGAFLSHGVTLRLEGDSNDYIGKGISGGKIIVVPPENSDFVPSENVIIGNVAFYGAIAGEAYIRGIAGERFCVRNSGVNAVVEGIGDHGCEYMTGGRVVILGKTGRNFAAGMSGGIAYIYDPKNELADNCANEPILLEKVTEQEDIDLLRSMLEKHLEYTGSDIAKSILDSFEEKLSDFIRVIPKDYKKVIAVVKDELAKGSDDETAKLKAFEEVTGKTVATA